MKIRQFSSLFILIYLGVILNSSAQSENAVIGLWYNTEKTAQVEILKSGSEYIGKISFVSAAITNGKPALDINNSDPKLKTRPLVGLVLMKGLKYEDGMWKDGEIYDPKSGKTYSCELKLKSEKILEIRGYLGFSFVGKTVEWTRIK